MRAKTSVTLSSTTLRQLDEFAVDSNRSRVIEQAVLEYLARKRREQRDASELALLNQAADELNEEMDDVLAYQVVP